MQRVVKLYLLILPFFSLIAIISSIYRSALQDSFLETYLLAGALMDSILILFGWRYILNKTIGILVLFLISSLIIGLLSNELSRRFITDFSNPFFFFSKIYIFRQYWLKNEFSKFTKYYTQIAFIGSLVLLPLTYLVFSLNDASRLAIFPPLELPFSFFMTGNLNILLVAAFFMILLYGKRAQLVSSALTFLFYVYIFKRKQIFKYSAILVVAGITIFFIIQSFPNNLAVSRLKYSMELYLDKSDDKNIDKLSAGRFTETETIISLMDFKDVFIGKGFGFTYYVESRFGDKLATNGHFSPVAFVSKYGIFFAIFIYGFYLSLIIKTKREFLQDRNYTIALSVALFTFFESFFAYTFFVSSIFPIALGFVFCVQSKRKARLANPIKEIEKGELETKPALIENSI